MRKLFILLLALAAVLCLCACGKDDSAETQPNATTVSGDPDNSTDPSKPDDPATPTEPTEPTKPTKPVSPENVEKTVVNLNDYVVVRVEGYDTYGKAYADLDRDKLYEGLLQRAALWQFGDGYYFEVDPLGEGELLGEFTKKEFEDLLDNLIAYLDIYPYAPYQHPDSSLEVPTNFSNGDQINVQWIKGLEFEGKEFSSYQVLEKVLAVEFVFSECTAVVQGLTPLREVDPFESIRLDVRGSHGEAFINPSSPWATVYITLNDGTVKEFNVQMTVPANNGSLKNGDKIHVSFKAEKAQSICDYYQIRFTRTEADIEIHGLNGNLDYVPGTPGEVNLKDYVLTSRMRYRDDGEYIEFCIDGYSLLRDNLQYLSENVAEEDLLGWDNSFDAALWLLNGQVGVFTCKNSPYDETRGIAVSGLSDGDVLEMSWDVDHAVFEHLQRLLNVELVFEDFTYTYHET